MEQPHLSSQNPSQAGDRRETPRRKKQIKVLVSDAEGKARPAAAWLLDRSIGGLCLSVSREVPAGTILSVRPVNAPADVTWIPVEVKSCRAAENSWELGCQFVRTPSYSVLLLFG